MTRRDIRAHLRAAVKAGILEGWYQPTRDTFLINPAPAPTRTFSTVEAEDYCLMLAEGGIVPLYRASDPASI